MSLTITISGGTTVEYAGSRTQEIVGEYDRQLYRPPFSKKWRQAGDGRPNPESVRVTVEVADAAELNALIDDAAAATSLESVFWRGGVEGLVNAIPVPIEGGYAVTLEWLTVAHPNYAPSVLSWQTWGQEDVTFADVADSTFSEFD